GQRAGVEGRAEVGNRRRIEIDRFCRDRRRRERDDQDANRQQRAQTCRHVSPLAPVFSYFQFRDLPSPIHSIACVRRRVRVSSVFAPVIHSTYSRLWLGENSLNAVCAFAFFPSADERSAGTRTGVGSRRTRSTFTPASFSAAAFLI